MGTQLAVGGDLDGPEALGIDADVAHAIGQLLDAPGRRSGMGRVGRHRVAAEISWDHSEEPLLGAYESALGLTRRRG